MSFEFNLPLQALRESFVLATSCYVDERAATSRERVAVPPESDSARVDGVLQQEVPGHRARV